MTPTGADGRVPYLPCGDPVHLDGVIAGNRIVLEPWLHAQRGPLVATDLSLGGWRPAQLTAELAAQLGVALPPGEATPVPEGELNADTVGRWVDAEARGDTAVAQADRAVRTLLPALADVATVVVAVPGRPEDWRALDRWALRFLAAAAGPAGFCLVLVHGDASATLPPGMDASWRPLPDPCESLASAAAALLDPMPPPEARWLGLVPGIIAPPLAKALGIGPDLARHLVMLPSGVALVPPELRTAATDMDVPELARRATAVPWLAAYIGRGAAGASHLCLKEAWRAFGAGATDLARTLAGYAVAAATETPARVAASLGLHSMQLVCQDYEGLAQAAPPPEDAPAEDRRRVDRFRAWGRALSGDADGALDLFGGAPTAAPLDPQPWLDLYLRNITALALFRSGATDAALAVEHDIADRLAHLDVPSWHLRYLNALNLSRLYRALGQPVPATEWLERAEETTHGVALPSDLLHFQVLRARLAEDKGDAVAATRHWQAAALIFAALPRPEALGWRVAAAIAGRRTGTADPEVLAGALLDHLGNGETGPPATFLLADRLTVTPDSTAIGAPGWGVLATETPLPPPFDGANHSALRARLTGIVGHEAPTVAVDLRHGLGLPDALPALAEVALWHGVPLLIWDGRAVDLDALLDNAGQRLALAPGVAAVEGRTVRFKRYRLPLTLSAREAALVARTGRAVETLAAEEQAQAAELVAAGVLVAEVLLPANAEVAAHG